MTPTAFKNRRLKMFGTQAMAAAALCVTREAVAQWESGKNRVPAWAVKMLALMERLMMATGPESYTAADFCKTFVDPKKIRYLKVKTEGNI